MPTNFTTFPITGRKTSEFTLKTALPATANAIFWSGVTGENLERITIEDFVNEANKHLNSAVESLSDDKEIGTSDTFVQILSSGAAARAITVVDGVSCFVHNSTSSANILTVEGTELSPGESCFVFWDGSAAHTVVKLAAGGGTEGSPFLTTTNTDLGDATYYFYGGTDANGDWKINRFTKSDLATKLSATELNNVSYASLAAAWADRTSLTYA